MEGDEAKWIFLTFPGVSQPPLFVLTCETVPVLCCAVLVCVLCISSPFLCTRLGHSTRALCSSKQGLHIPLRVSLHKLVPFMLLLHRRIESFLSSLRLFFSSQAHCTRPSQPVGLKFAG